MKRTHRFTIVAIALGSFFASHNLLAAPVSVPEWGTARIEAENYDEGGQNVGYFKKSEKKNSTARSGNKEFRAGDAVSTSNANKGIVISNWDKGDWTRYTVNAAVAGSYEMRFCYSHPGGKDSNLSITVNGESQIASLPLPPSRDPWTYIIATAVIQLRQGENVLQLGSDIGQMNVDCFDLSHSTTFNNKGCSWLLARKGATHIEAEDFDVTPESAASAKKPAASTYRPDSPLSLATCNDGANGFALTNFGAGDHVEYTLNATLSGYYTVRIRHAGPAAKLQMLLNNTDRTGALSLPATGGASEFKTTECRVLMKKGPELLRLKGIEGAAIINWIEIEKDTAMPVVLADPSGKGSYAAEPPDEALDAVNDLFTRVYETKYKWINRPAGEPIPTNDWYSNLLDDRDALTGSLWPYPSRVTVNQDGITFTGHNKLSNRPGNIGLEGAQGIQMVAVEGKLTRNAVVNFGDWSVCFRAEQTPEKYMDITLGRGMPMAWFEYHDLNPALKLGGAGLAVTDGKGKKLDGAFTADRLRIDRGEISFGLFAPEGTRFNLKNADLSVEFKGNDHYLVLALLPTPNAFELFAEHAYAIPRDTKYDFSYDSQKGQVTTQWTIDAKPLKPGASTDIIQGWVPHNYRDIVAGPKLLPDWSYVSINGPIKLSVGKQFTIVQPANNLSLVWPTPKSTGGKSDYDAQRMTQYMDKVVAGDAAVPKYGDDTYFGMKAPQEFAEQTLIARQMNHPGYPTLLKALKTSMTDWFTYTPGETAHYFATYPGTGALIGFKPSFGSENFTDNHFHYGYHTASAGVLAMLDPQWGKDYGAMAKLVAKQYANWDRADKRFPYLRTFECWSGHSYAGGTGDGRGNNQESVSEAIQSWAGLVFLGQALGDEKMTAAGMMGYITETKAASEYWWDGHRDLFPKTYDRANVAINYDDSKGAGTFFSGEPEHVLGIIALPIWPDLDYQSRWPETMKYAVRRMLDERPTHHKGDQSMNTWSSFENGKGGANAWLNINLGILAHADPQAAAEEYDRLWNEKTPTGISGDTAMYYWQVHAYRSNGQRDFTRRLSTPIGAAYYEQTSKRRVYVAYNPSAAPVDVQVFDQTGKVVDHFQAKPQEITFHAVE